MKLNYTENGNGKIVIMLHGNSGSLKEMMFLEKLLSEKYKVINIDLPCHGKSEFEKNKLSIKYCAHKIGLLLKSKNIYDFSGIGFSDGANVLIEMMNDEYLKITKASLISPNENILGIKFHWILFYYMVMILSFPLRFIFFFEKFYQRMRMMIFYRADFINNKNIDISLFYAEHDVFTKKDKEIMIGRLKPDNLIIIPHSNHINILKSKALTEAVYKMWLNG